MSYTEEFEKMNQTTYRTGPKPIEEFNYAVMKCFGSMKHFMNECDEKLKRIHESVSKFDENDYRWNSYYKKNIDPSKDIPYIFNKLSELYISIKTYWNMMGSLILPIRNYIPHSSEFYSYFRELLNIDVLNKIKFGNFVYDDLSDVRKIEYGEGYKTFVEGLGTILHCVEKVSILSNIKTENKDDINWAFESYMKLNIGGLMGVDFDGENKNNMFVCAFDIIIEDILNNANEEQKKIFHGFDIERVAIGVINILLYKSYEYMTNKYIEEIKYVYEILNKNKDERVMKYIPFDGEIK